MNEISLVNPTILQKLTDFSNWFFNEFDYKQLDDKQFVSESPKGPMRESITDSYLKKMVDSGRAHDGFPEVIRGHELTEYSGKQEYDPELVKRVDDLVFGMEQLLCVKRNAVALYYPADGYIGWHTNWNASGYNVLFHFSQTGEGFFEYVDPITKEHHQVHDKPGWTAKVGYFGNIEEPDQVVYHKAETKCPRLTFAYVIPDKDLWEMMIEDLEDSEEL